MFLMVKVVEDWQDLGFWFKVGRVLNVEALDGLYFGFGDFLIAKDHCKVI